MSLLPVPSIQLARSLPGIGLDDLPALSAFQLFTNQMESGSTEACVDAMKRLPVVATAMGRDEASAKLLPYLTNVALKQPPYPDELLLLLGQQLPDVVSLLGPKCVLELLPLLERLAAVEETVVRDQAVAVIKLISEDYVDNTSTETVTALVGVAKRLAGADWFTAKVSACGTIAPILRLLVTQTPPNVTTTTELLHLYRELCHDDTPMVRRAAAKHLGACLNQAGPTPHGREFALQTLPTLQRDEQDSVRLLAAAALGTAGEEFGKANPQWTAQHWLPLLKDGSTDMSWRVRHNLSKHFSDVAFSLGIDKDRRFWNEQSLVMACFVSLLTDVEAEVRAAAVGHLAKMVAWGGPQHFASHLQPLLPALADDVVMEVRSKCALALMDAAHGGTLDDAVILQAFGPLLESFLQDEFHEVQLQVLTNLHKISHLLPGLSGVVTALLHMAKASNWRVREAVAKLLPHLAEARGLDFFQSVLMEPAWLTLLLDPVASVRMAIVHGMPLLVTVAGQDWMIANLLPQHVRIYNSNSHSYLVRITILQAHIEMTVQAASGPLWNDGVLQILRGLSDKVANVRMVSARGLGRLVGADDGGGDNASIISAQILPALEKRIQEEEDPDCRQACQIALEQVK